MRASLVRPLVAVLALALLVTAFVAVRPLAPDSKACPDFIQFWTAATLLSSGHSPYDPARQAAIQRDLGWRKELEGLGRYEFLPYYYPPWLALACAALLPLGYVGARAAWLAINGAALLAAAFLLRDIGPARTDDDAAAAIARRSPLAIVIFIVLFAPAVVAVLMGQVSPLVLLAIAAVWKFLHNGRDVAAGVVLSWLTIKPQLTIILIVALLAWCLRRRRWRVPAGFAAALGVLVVVSSLVYPSWLFEMIEATSATELPSHAFPWTGTTAYAIFELAGLRGVMLWTPFLVVALPAIAVAARAALDPASRLEGVFGLGLLAPFFVATYARHYDFPILLIPVLFLVSDSGRLFRVALIVTLLVLPYVQLALFPRLAAWCNLPAFPGPQVTFYWIPLLIALAWFVRARSSAQRLPKHVFRVS